MSQYRETLHRWAAQHVPEGARVTGVDVYDDPGYRYSSYTYENPHVDVTICYELYGKQCSTSVDAKNLGEILTQLFAIEEGPAVEVQRGTDYCRLPACGCDGDRSHP